MQQVWARHRPAYEALIKHLLQTERGFRHADPQLKRIQGVFKVSISEANALVVRAERAGRIGAG